ncbi:MAG: DUF1501 domain-containing protein [Pseudomonadota bacterium]
MQSRRSFLQALGAGLTVATLPSGAWAQPKDYKALVCVTLIGGVDSHDCLVPVSQSAYGSWQRARSAMLQPLDEGQRARENLLTLTPGGQGMGFVPELSGLHTLYERGDLAVVANAGPLVEPVTRQAIADKTAVLPPRLASHNDQRSIWQTNEPEGATTGWGGRMIDAMALGGDFSSVSVRRNASFVVGQTTPGLTINPGGVKLPFGFEERRFSRTGALDDILRDHFRGVRTVGKGAFENDIIALQRRAYDTSIQLARLVNDNPAGADAVLEKNPLSEQLAMVARLISVQRQLGVQRQVFSVFLSKFDTHNNQFRVLPGLQRTLGDALLAFQNSINAMGVADQVTTFTISDFGRTLVSNASGTDHGWGGHHYVMGGAVKGGRVLGEVPPYETGHPLDWRRGAMIPTLSIEQYGGALGTWFGLDADGLRSVFPRIGNFDADKLALF